MKKLILTLTVLTFTTCSFSQEISKYVVSSGGIYSTGGGYSNSSTIGESMVATLTSASNVLTQGFQQGFSAPNDPAITITNPLDGASFTTLNSATVNFDITDFMVAAGTGDGHIHYYVNGAMTMKYDTLPINLNGLTNGSHQIIIKLVDNYHQDFTPTIADTVSFSVNVIYGCTNSLALNYDASATISDGSCIYEEVDLSEVYDLGFTEGVESVICPETSSCPSDLNSDGLVGTSDLLILLSSFGIYCEVI